MTPDHIWVKWRMYLRYKNEWETVAVASKALAASPSTAQEGFLFVPYTHVPLLNGTYTWIWRRLQYTWNYGHGRQASVRNATINCTQCRGLLQDWVSQTALDPYKLCITRQSLNFRKVMQPQQLKSAVPSEHFKAYIISSSLYLLLNVAIYFSWLNA